MNNPVTRYLSERPRRRTIAILLLLNAAIIAVMSTVGVALKPYTIIDFELAGSWEKASVMLQAWRENDAMPALFFVLGFDYLFMLVYSISLWFVCLHLADVVSSLKRFMIILAWLQPVAAVLDAIENAALFEVALGSDNPVWPVVSWWSAVPKFVIALSGGVFWLALTSVKLFRRTTS